MTQELLCHILFHSRRYSRLLFKLNDKFYSKIEDYAIELHQTTCLTKFSLLQGNLTKLSYIPKICLKFVNLNHKYIVLARVCITNTCFSHNYMKKSSIISLMFFSIPNYLLCIKKINFD